jgi:hypothetical protein
MSKRTWLYGLTADEWLDLAARGEDSEVPPCCGNLGTLRELLNALATCQADEDTGTQLYIGREVLLSLEGDGNGHGLDSRAGFPLLHRVLDGIRAQQADPDPFGLHRQFIVSDSKGVPVGGTCPTLGEFDAEDEAARFIATLPEPETGRYSLDDMLAGYRDAQGKYQDVPWPLARRYHLDDRKDRRESREDQQ